MTFFLISDFANGQIDFNHYKTIASKGIIPEDFTKETYTKLEEDLKEGKKELSSSQEKIFFQGTNYAIDELLHSGWVVYGDEISTYVTEIADKLLRNDPTLRAKLRFYTIKSTSTNAFSTDQGIVFVTTGLISQLTSEAQLAYVLAHEISHFTESHVVETFDWKSQNYRQNDRIERLSQYSKDKEFEADKIGIKLYNEAGYSKNEIFSTFDVLMYSYLPFDEVEFPVNYFNTGGTFVPLNLFPDKKYEIKAMEDYDDSKSSHPNIKKRKESAEKEVGTFVNWGNETQFLGNDRFILIRNIARFESVRSDILEANYGNALYSLFLLERDFPNSIYLSRMKAQIWMNLMMYKKENKSSKTVDKTSDLEGESAAIHFFLKKLTKDGMISLALRQVYDSYKKYPEDPELNAIFNSFLKSLASTESFKLEAYSKKTFSEAASDFEKAKSDSTSIPVVDTSTVVKSKYDRIKSKKNVANPSNFDTTKFYLYALSDVIIDTAFLQRYEKNVEIRDEQTKKGEEINLLSDAERRKYDLKQEQNSVKLGIDQVIVVEPKVFSYRSGEIDPVKSEKIEAIYSSAIVSSATDVGIETFSIDRRSLSSKGTEGFNERNTLMVFLAQIAEEDDVNVFPVDFTSLQEIQQYYGTSKVMFTIVEHERKVDINGWALGFSAIVYPTFPIVLGTYVPIQLFKCNHTEMNVIILDIEKGVVDSGQSFYWNEPIYKHNLGTHMFNLFYNLHSKPL